MTGQDAEPQIAATSYTECECVQARKCKICVQKKNGVCEMNAWSVKHFESLKSAL